MINIVYCVCGQSEIPDGISEERKRKIEDNGNKSLREQMIGAAKVLKTGFGLYGINEREVIYVKNDFGKPYALDSPEVYFSLSHTDGFAVAAFGGAELGLDCERSDRQIPDKVIGKYFTAEEQKAYGNESIRLWTLLESYGKFTGRGLVREKNRDFHIPYFKSEYYDGSIFFRFIRLCGFDVTVCGPVKDEIRLVETK